MKINGSIFDPLRPDRSAPLDRSSGKPTGDAQKSANTPATKRTDSVQISDTARSMAAKAQTEKTDQMDPTRVADLRRKVYEGAYNSLDVVDQVARRVLARGDV